MKTYITLNTNSEYRNAKDIKIAIGGKELQVVQFFGNIVSAKVPENGFNEQGEPQGEYVTLYFQFNQIASTTSN
jgi:hypothetical protein